jgi:putative endonuclease
MKGFVYIMTNENNSVLYTGVTSDLIGRMFQHKSKKHPKSFTARYNIRKLVYFELFGTIGEAIKREKQIKAGSRKKRIDLINSMNPDWVDLSNSLHG